MKKEEIIKALRLEKLERDNEIAKSLLKKGFSQNEINNSKSLINAIIEETIKVYVADVVNERYRNEPC